MLMVVPGGDLERVTQTTFIRRKLPNENGTGRNSLLGRQSGGSSLLKMGKDHNHHHHILKKQESETVAQDKCRMQEATAATSMDSPEKGARLHEKRIMGRGNVQAKS